MSELQCVEQSEAEGSGLSWAEVKASDLGQNSSSETKQRWQSEAKSLTARF